MKMLLVAIAVALVGNTVLATATYICRTVHCKKGYQRNSYQHDLALVNGMSGKKIV